MTQMFELSDSLKRFYSKEGFLDEFQSDFQSFTQNIGMTAKTWNIIHLNHFYDIFLGHFGACES